MVPPGWVVKRGLQWKVVLKAEIGGEVEDEDEDDEGEIEVVAAVAAEEGQRSDQVQYKGRRGQGLLLSMGVIASEVSGSDGVSGAAVIAPAILCSHRHRVVGSQEICTLTKA